MIAFLRGEVAAIGTSHVVLDVGGVGYRVVVSGKLGATLVLGEQARLFTAHLARVDGTSVVELLYGFQTEAERDGFETLRNVNGIGPRHAMAALGTLGLDPLVAAVEGDDVRALSKVSGIGPKTARRMCLELKGKLLPSFGAAGVALPGARPAPMSNDSLPLALAQLGYRKSEIDQAMGAEAVPKEGVAAIEDRLRAALQFLSGGHR